jgi:4-amino-4-deoxy-L-arabinose transferase-like glycosyltransferase
MRHLAIVTAILLLGAALRLHGLGAMLGMTHYDEAYYGVDALSLIAQPRFTPFFPDNFGRESLWMYLLSPSLAVFGGGSFGLRIVAVFTGVLTLAAVYRLARELIGERGALWATAALAVLFWHVLASHEAFRALLFPLVGALAFAFLWQARRTDRLVFWMIGGVLLGLLAYTYLAARLWLALAGVTLLWWFVRGRRRGTVVAAVIAGMISLPLLAYLLTNPAAAGQRVEQVAVGDVPTLLNNVVAWLGLWLIEGTQDVVYNLPGRPLLDVPMALLFIAGLVTVVTIVRRERAIWLVALIGVSIAPALLTTEPLKWLRAIGLNVPLAVVLGAGALGLERAFALSGKKNLNHQDAKNAKNRLLGAQRAVPLLVLCLLVVAGVNTVRDFDTWVASPDLFFPMEQHLYAGIDWVAANTPPDAPVYFAPFAPDHPVLRLRERQLGERPVGAFMPAQCLVLNERPAYYFTLPMYTPGFAEQLGDYAAVETMEASDPRYTIYRAEPHAELPDDWTTIGGRIEAENINPLPGAARNGDTLELMMAFRRVGEVDRPYTMFAHLYGVDEKVGIMLIGQDDQPICPSYPPALWREGETIIQRYSIPVDTSVYGEFAIGIGIYDSVTLERLPVSGESSIQPIHRLRIN